MIVRFNKRKINRFIHEKIVSVSIINVLVGNEFKEYFITVNNSLIADDLKINSLKRLSIIDGGPYDIKV